jgi:predicted TIM-barrel fold metal-dependent hydrolase
MSIVDTLGLVSGDSHVNEPRGLWSDNLPASLRSQALRGIKPGADGNWDLILAGEPHWPGSEPEEERVKTNNVAHRYAIMREEGVVGECIYPTVGLNVWYLSEPELGRASCRVYNEWMAEGLARSLRFKCAGLVPTWRVEDAIDEVTWIAGSGLGAVMLPAVFEPSWNHRTWEPMWKVIEETRLPVVMHQGTGHSMIFYRGPGAGVSNLVSTQSLGPRTAVLLAATGVLANHPGLHFVFVEYNSGWLSWIMDTADYYTRAFRDRDADGKHQWVNHDIPELPSYYLRRQVHATFQDDLVGVHNIPLTGASGVIWGSDYPHGEGTYPNSRETVARLAKHIDSDQDVERVFRRNAAELFHFDESILSTPL